MSILCILNTASDIFSEITERDVLFWRLIDHSVKENVKIQRVDVSKILNGSRDISKTMAAEILRESNKDENRFQNYIETEIKKESETSKRKAIIEDLEDNPYNVDIDDLTENNVAEFFTKIWFKYIKNCRDKIQHRKPRIKIAASPDEISERLKKVIKKLQDMTEDSPGFTDATELRNKIDKKKEFHLFKKIQGNIMDYFIDIRTIFIEEQETTDLVFEGIRRMMRNKYLDRKEKSPKEVFHELVDWLMREVSTTDREACEAVISFFVQNCEVFEK